MKFLCDNCKAKYQIADDKVAGKTVRMKCRKCGHLIEIRASAALAEATAFRSLPAEELSRIVDPSTGAAAAASASPSSPAPAAPAPRPAAGAAPGRAPSAGAPRRTTTASPATGAPAPRPGAAPVRSIGATASAGAGAGVTKGATALARAPEPAPEPEETPATGGLASAFSQSVGSSVAPDDPAAGSSFDMGAVTAEEWYSGINGVPVGPMRLSELRSKIAAGLITEESLVWREGFEEWVALRTVPALVELARTSAPNEKLSATPSGRRAGSVRTSASNVVSLRPEAGEAPKTTPSSPDEHDDATSVFSGAMLGGAFGAGSSEPGTPVAAGTPATTGASASDGAASGLSAMADPFAAPAPVLGAASTDVAPVAATPLPAPVVAAEPAPARQAARIPAMAWVVVALALAVGVVGGTMLVPKPPADVTVQTVVVEKVVAAPTPATPDVTARTGDSDPVTDPGTAAKRPSSVGPGPRTTSPSTQASVAAVTPPPNSLPPLPGQNSPSPLPTSATPPTSTDTIPAGKLQEIVSGQRNSLRRVCWDPYVSSGAAAGSVKANVSLTIVNGQVTSVSVSGADARMSGCVQNRVRGWQFPTGYAPTNTSFVLAFVAQQ